MVSNGELKIVEIQAATAIAAHNEVAIGGELDVTLYDTMTIFFDYVKGDETSFDIIPKVLMVTGGDEHPACRWSEAASVMTVTADKYRVTADGKHYIVLSIKGIHMVRIYGEATGGTPTGGTIQVGYTIGP